MSGDDYPVMRHWMNGGMLVGLLGDLMEVEVRSALAEIERLREQRPTLLPSAHELLTAEIDRLRAAGDALAEVVDDWPELLAAWQEARNA